MKETDRVSQVRGFAASLTDFIFTENEPLRSDIIFIPGSGYPELAERAAELYREGYAPRVLPSGRYYIYRDAFQGARSKADLYGGTYETEWSFLKEVLIRNGVPESAILKEDEATYTYQNALFSRRVTDEAGLKIERAIVCCKTYHARRCRMYYELVYPEADILICPAVVKGITRESWMTTEKGIETVTSEVTRCGSQFVDILKELL